MEEPKLFCLFVFLFLNALVRMKMWVPLRLLPLCDGRQTRVTLPKECKADEFRTWGPGTHLEILTWN